VSCNLISDIHLRTSYVVFTAIFFGALAVTFDAQTPPDAPSPLIINFVFMTRTR
jgi:hypothetical protein